MGIHVLQRRQIVAAPLENCWRFFSDPRNLAKITPPALDFQIIGEPAAEMYAGMMIQYRVRPLLGIPMRWLTEITRVEPMRYFVDEQRVGPYKVWHHEHGSPA
jgi:ligand-binding SRPBCC domain-containing protein